MSELDDLPSWAGRSTEEVELPGGPPETDSTAEDQVPDHPARPEKGQPEIAAPTASALGTADEPATVTDPVRPEKAKRRRLRPLLLALLGLIVLGGAAVAGYVLAIQDSDSTEASGGATDAETATADDAAETDAPAADGEDAAADGNGTAAADANSDAGTTEVTDAGTGTEEADGEGAATVTVEVDGGSDGDAETTDAGGDTDPLNDGDRQAIFRGGVVYLSGAVPSEEIGQAIVDKAEAIVGEGNVVNEYTIDPSVTIEPGSSAPLYVEDVILFGFNSIEIAPPFLPILDLGTLLLRQNPQASVTVVTRTDAVGSEEVNLEVARRRAQAVINYWLGQGVDPDQIEADPRGEEGASDDDDAETAARQRRAEFIITGLLD